MQSVKWYDIKNENQIASEWLLYYPDRRQVYLQTMQNFSELSATIYTGMPHGTDMGRPAENKGITLAEIKDNELWIMTIEDVQKILSEKRLAFLEFRRRAELIKHDGDTGRPDWRGYVQNRYSEWHLQRYGKEYVPHENTLKTWWNDIVNLTVRVAIRRKCL